MHRSEDIRCFYVRPKKDQRCLCSNFDISKAINTYLAYNFFELFFIKIQSTCIADWKSNLNLPKISIGIIAGSRMKDETRLNNMTLTTIKGKAKEKIFKELV
jgi:hypothetical protein